ncbi:MAG: hypothetical protein HEP71_34945 [Roseivirga sp.]|nr:hypothetical protein [Roseivirga sp.]
MKSIVPLLLISLILISSCKAPEKEEPKEPVAAVEVPEEPPETYINSRIPDHQFSITDFQINEKLENLDLKGFKHFGEFYTDDFTIFRLSRIDYLAEAHFIDDINLFFIDSVLVKMQAFLRVDRTNDFLGQYGRAKIYVSDYSNKKLLETESVLTKVNGKTRINEKLNQYTLKWVREELDISYEVNKKVDTTAFKGKEYSEIKLASGDQYRYKLTFQSRDFENQMAWVKWESYKESRGLKATKPSSD